MHRLILLLTLALLAACGRPLSTHEADLASRLFGPSLDLSPIRLSSNGLVGLIVREIPARPRTTCRERIVPPPEGPTQRVQTAGVTLGNQVNIRRSLFRPDYARNADGTMSLGAAMFLAHELTHVWQWQNRAVTGYSPWRVSTEHRPGVDPYLFSPADHARFADFGYEQQASLVEEYVCCMALDPEGARTARLHRLLAQVMQPGDLPDVALRVPWAGVQRRGICG